MTLRVEMPVKRMFFRAGWVVRNNGNGVFFRNSFAQWISILGGIGDKYIGGKPLNEPMGLRAIPTLAPSEDKSHRAAQTAYSHVDFRAQPAARTAQGLIFSPPFFAPEAC